MYNNSALTLWNFNSAFERLLQINLRSCPSTADNFLIVNDVEGQTRLAFYDNNYEVVLVQIGDNLETKTIKIKYKHPDIVRGLKRINADLLIVMFKDSLRIVSFDNRGG